VVGEDRGILGRAAGVWHTLKPTKVLLKTFKYGKS
jgi:hypothetical protein